MRISVMADPWSGSAADVLEEATFAGSVGADTYWLAQVWRMDSMTLIPSLAAAAGPDLKFGSGIVCSYLRHPVTLASQALTTNVLVDGRYTLGVGLSHQVILEPMFGIDFTRPLRAMREYLDVLLPAIAQQPVDADGETVSFHGAVDVPGAAAPDVVLAALGPQMLRLCGERTAGTITWMTGPQTLAGYVVPAITAAAERGGRDAPRIVALVPMWITDDTAAARTASAERLDIYGMAPSYRSMLQREGWAAPEDAVLIGNEDHVRASIERYREAGATEMGIQILGTGDDRDRTRAFVADLITT